MYALALWDERRGRLLLARDRFGIKPLYVAELEDGLAFASELRPLLALGVGGGEDADALAGYLALGWVSGEATGLAGVRRLLPGPHARARRRRRARAPLLGPAPPVPDHSSETLARRLSLHLRSDVPLAVLLSGGLDSR